MTSNNNWLPEISLKIISIFSIEGNVVHIAFKAGQLLPWVISTL